MSKSRYVLQVHVGAFSNLYEALSIEASKQTTAADIVACIAEKLGLSLPRDLELAEVVHNASGEECKERHLGPDEFPVALQLLWPQQDTHRFCLRERLSSQSALALPSGSSSSAADAHLLQDYFLRFLYHQPRDRDYSDLCQLPDLTEQTLLENLKARFERRHIYTYVGSILIAVNPFKFYPIYNPKYVRLYQNRRLGDLPPHIFAVADAAYHAMLRSHSSQCVVISGESGSGKTESANLLLHHLTALSQKGSYGRGVEQTILSAGPVLEAFGNAKTKHNNNSSRFGKFIQVNYRENGMVHGAVVQKYLLEKSRIVSQAKKERNYHVFYYLLAGASKEEREELHLTRPEDYYYLNQSQCYTLEGTDEAQEYTKLMESMRMVGFNLDKRKRLIRVLSAVLHLGNIQFSKKSTYHSDEAVQVKNPEVLSLISSLLGVKEETLNSALTTKRAKAPGETLVISYKMPEAVATRDAMAKCLYGALFDWIVMQVNHALLSAKDFREHKGNSISVLDIFGFEDFGDHNSFEQFCINFANEHLQYYFNQHVFKYEQEEYQKEGIHWKNIEFTDNTGCLGLIEGKPHGLLCLLNDQCNFSGATNAMLLQKFQNHHKKNPFYDMPQKRENAFLVHHYAGRVKYQIKDFKEKNLDLMRPDVVMVLKSSSVALVRELVGADPVAVFRWAILRAFFRSYHALRRPSTSSSPLHAGQGHPSVVPKKSTAGYKARNSSDGSLGNQAPSRRSSLGSGACPGILAATSCPVHRGNTHLCASEASVLERANQIMMKNKNTRSRSKVDKGLKNLQSVKTVVGRTHPHPQRTGRKPPTVTAQFQVSLSHLMEALNQANPFFVRCIKSNAGKVPCSFDEGVILQQLRYTGMLETVRIRQSGYSVRLPFEEFIQRYRVLLPRGLISSRSDIRDFLLRVNLDRNNYQMGKTKVFLRESEKLKLDELLHLQILQRIITVQRYIRAWLQRRHFRMLRAAVVRLQCHARGYLVRRRLALERMQHGAAIVVQRSWRRYRDSRRAWQLHHSIVPFQAACRGYLFRRRMADRHQQGRTAAAFRGQKGLLLPNGIAGADQLLLRRSIDSEESTHEDSENESLASEGGGNGMASPPMSPGAEASVTMRGEATFREKKNLIHKLSTSEASNMPLKGKETQKVPVRKCLSEITPDNSFNKQVPEQQKKRSPSGSSQQNSVQEDSSASCLAKEEMKGPLHKARKHFKTFIGSKKEKKENRDDTDESGGEEALSLRPEGLCTEPMPGERKQSVSHTLKPLSARSKSDLCSVCKRSMTLFINQGSKCTRCKLLFHPECIYFSEKVPCRGAATTGDGGGGEPTPPARSHKPSRTPSLSLDPSQPPQLPPKQGSHTLPPQQQSQGGGGGSWNVTRTAEFKDPGDILITDVSELTNLDSFLVKKVGHLSSASKKRDSTVDMVFKKALKNFKSNLISTYSAAAQDGRLCLRYKDLTDHFEQVARSVIDQECSRETFPLTMAVNAFRVFLDEFRNLYRSENKPKSKGKKRKRKKKASQLIEHCGHVFALVVINIPTACEVCSNSLWLTERGLVCQGCKLTCHKKCYQKVSSSCRDVNILQGRKVFGVPLDRLVGDDVRIPVVVERLITTIELKGLYVEGIYRKSGIASRVTQLKQDMDDDPEGVDLDSYPIHVLTATLKAFFRDMPEPLMTFELYDSFLLATNFQDPDERVQAIFMETKKLPSAHYDLFERLAFHLARVAQHQEFNRMSPESLAIVFAPCILRTNKRLQAQDTLDCVNKQTICVRCIIQEQLKKVQNTLADIDTLDTAVSTVVTRLSSLRSSRLSLALEPNGSQLPPPISSRDEEEEEALLTQQIESLEKEKALLTTVLPTLALSGSDDDLLSTDMDSAAGSLDDVRPYDDASACAMAQADQRHHPKTRVSTPLRRLQPPRYPPGTGGPAPGLSASASDTSVVSLYKPTEVDDEAIMV